MFDDIDSLKEEEKKQDDYTHTSQSPHRHAHPNWLPGVVLIAVGVIFLFANLTGFYLQNWWALFILIPAISNFGKAWEKYQRNGRFTHSARRSLTGGAILTLIASAFLFDLDWGLVWPFFLIIGGVAALFNGWFE